MAELSLLGLRYALQVARVLSHLRRSKAKFRELRTQRRIELVDLRLPEEQPAKLWP